MIPQCDEVVEPQMPVDRFENQKVERAPGRTSVVLTNGISQLLLEGSLTKDVESETHDA